jgi:hypothetical protein
MRVSDSTTPECAHLPVHQRAGGSLFLCRGRSRLSSPAHHRHRLRDLQHASFLLLATSVDSVDQFPSLDGTASDGAHAHFHVMQGALHLP